VVTDKIGEGGSSSIIRDRDTMREGEGRRRGKERETI